MNLLIILFLFILLIIFYEHNNCNLIENYNNNNSNNTIKKYYGNTLNTSNVSFELKVVNTPESLKKGLMFRKKKLKDNNNIVQGMLFDFGEMKPLSMWMKNTFIPLDILFVDNNGIIVDIKETNKPHDLTSIKSDYNARYAIELNENTVKKYKINIGDNINHFNVSYIDELE